MEAKKQFRRTEEDGCDSHLAQRRRYEYSIFLDLGREGATLVDREIELLLDAAIGSAWTDAFDISAKTILSSFRDDPAYETKWKVDGEALVKKIERLTDAQAWFLGGFLRGWRQCQGEVQ